MINTAKKFLKLGLSPLPIRIGSKRPNVLTWGESTLYDESQVDLLFKGTDTIAVITGAISENLECIDFDNHLSNANEIFSRFMGRPDVYEIIKKYDLPYESTQSGGYHLFYRCSDVGRNMKLASIEDGYGSKKCVIETRGNGGYVIVAPSVNYKMLKGTLAYIATITPEERDVILSHCRSFNEVTPKEVQTSEGSRSYHVDKPGDLFNESHPVSEIASLLKHNGWSSTDDIHFTRPGKKVGVSATLGKCSMNGVPLFYVFSSNADPFESEKGYTPFSVFAMLGHGGDFTSAARELADRGYGKTQPVREKITPGMLLEELPQPEPKKIDKKKTPVIVEVEEYLDSVYEFRYDVVLNIVEYRNRGSYDFEPVNENTIYMELLRSGYKIGKDMVSSLLASDFVKRYDPFLEYFEHCPKWDGVDEFHELCQYLDLEEPEFFRDMLEKQFVRTIKCAIEPTFYNRFAFVLQSKEQEMGKSRLIRFFNPFGDKYFTDEQIKDDKDSLISLSENFIYSLEEIDDMKKFGVGKLKAVLAKKMVNVRHPYGKQKVNTPRRCSFFGSTNLDEFLTDDVNTRWLVFKINAIDERVFTRINMDALWSQAWALYNSPNYEWDLTSEEKKKRELTNMRHRQSTIEEDMILELFEYGDAGQVMSINSIIKDIRTSIGPGIRVNLDATNIIDILNSLGFKCVERFVMGRIVKFIQIRKRSGNLFLESKDV